MATPNLGVLVDLTTKYSLSLPALALALCLSLAVFISRRSSQRVKLTSVDRAAEKGSFEKNPITPQIIDASELAATLPPPRRGQLDLLRATLSPEQLEALGNYSAVPPPTKDQLLRLRENYAEADDSKFLFSGFSVKEVKALGNFPDYATLAGVPLPNPYPEHDINKAKPRPYRPFRWPYHQTMALKKFEPDWWLELESSYVARIHQRKNLYLKHGPNIAHWLPGSELASKELMEMAIQFLCTRYPQYFTLSEDKQCLENKILNISTMIRSKHPILVLLDHVPEDFVIMLRDPKTGMYVCSGGIICSALGFNLTAILGLRLPEIHEDVPDYKEKMEFSMDRYFSKMPTDKPIQRGSWEIVKDVPLHLPPGDPALEEQYKPDDTLTPSRLHLRVDWQTLRRLPLSGAIVFNFKAIFTPLENMRDEPYVPSLIKQVIQHGKENLLKYKNVPSIERVGIPLLEELEKDQIKRGLMEENWEVRTLDDSPYYPGWEAKWHAQQGF